MKTLENKVAIITGGAGGIGLATANLFLQEGAKVVIVDHDENNLKDASKELNNPNLKWFKADVSSSADTEAFLNFTLREFEKIDVFFINAGIEGKVSPLPDYPEEAFDKVIAVNLKGVWLGCKMVIPKMQDGGSVMITSSVAGLKGFSGLSAYVASKHGVIGLMRTAAIEFAPRKIRVNSIHPGPVDNRMMRSVESQISPDDPGQAKEGFLHEIPFQRYATSAEVAELALFLAGDSSKYLTGTVQVIDGGMNLL